MNANIEIPPAAAAVIECLRSSGHEAFVVGGCVRDSLLGREPKDWDVATSATPRQAQEAFLGSGMQAIPTGIRYGTLTVKQAEDCVEVTTYRIDGPYADKRRPSRVSFSASLQDDLARRDFTANAIAYSYECGLVDPFGGVRDIQAGLLKAVGDANARLEEDGLRIMRALRFASVLCFTLHPPLAASVHTKRGLLQNIAAERIRDELTGLLVGDCVADVMLAFPDVLAVPIPEIAATVGFDHKNRHHIYDVWEHTVRAIEAAKPDAAVRLALLFHDLGKPQTFTVDSGGQGHFPKHDAASAAIAAPRLRALRFANADVHMITELVACHQQSMLPKDLPRLLMRLGEANVRRILELRRADIIAHREANRERRVAQVEESMRALDEYLAGSPCYSLASLAVGGDDLIAIGHKPGRTLGEALQFLLDSVVSGALPNEREALLAVVQPGKAPRDDTALPATCDQSAFTR
jgi:tRNA nucleotidyltransferase (CCA-adding enzyme)